MMIARIADITKRLAELKKIKELAGSEQLQLYGELGMLRKGQMTASTPCCNVLYLGIKNNHHHDKLTVAVSINESSSNM